MNRSMLDGFGLAVVALICCIGIPLLLSGLGLTAIAELKEGFGPAIIVAIAVILLISAYAYFKRRKTSDRT